MKPDPQITAELWLGQSERDLTASSSLLGSGHYEQACFYSQQATEKALKALAYLQGARIVIGHSVRDLLNQLKDSHPQLEHHMESAQRLDQVYLTSRYPNALPGSAPYELFTKSQAEEAVRMADGIITEARQIMSNP